ncbi:hypothetical protein BDV10DRAFT_187457 [Aspergillus recurvatus]
MHCIYNLPLRGVSTSPVHFCLTHFRAKAGLRIAVLQTRQCTSYDPNTNGSSLFHPSSRLTGRTCMITGGSSGIGFAIAERFLNEGVDRIILVGRSHERLVRAAAQLERPATSSQRQAETGNGHDSYVATRTPEEDQAQDRRRLSPGTLVESSSRISLLVGDVSEAGRWSRELESAMHSVDVLINAAGVSTSAILSRTDPSTISQVLRTNLEGSLLTSRALIRASIRSRMKSRAGEARIPPKCIINISSLLALKGGTGAVPYAASKAGVLGLTRSLAAEAAKTLRNQIIRSNAIVPGYIETPMVADFSHAENDRLKEDIPLRRFGQPHEVADAAVFLAENEYANNCVVNLDGGLSAL